MRWQVMLEVRFADKADDLEPVLDRLMERMVEAGVRDPAIGATLDNGTAEIELTVDGDSIEAVQEHVRRLVVDVLHLPDGSELVAETVRRAETVPA